MKPINDAIITRSDIIGALFTISVTSADAKLKKMTDNDY